MKRERGKKITRLHIILFFLVVITGSIIFFVIRSKVNVSDETYKEYEKEIKEASMNYYNIHNIDLEVGYSKRININKLYDDGFLMTEEIIKKCNGYASITNDGSFEGEDDEIYYEAYIKCGNKYKTKGYEEE